MNSNSSNVSKHDLLVHLVAAILFGLLPFVFTPDMLETETTIRFFASGVLLVLTGTALLFRASAPAVSYSKINWLIIAFGLLCAFSAARSLNRGEAIYDVLKWWGYWGYFIIFASLFTLSTRGISIITKYANFSVFAFTLIALSEIGNAMASKKGFHINYQLGSSLGNKNFYAETMLLLLPLLLMASYLHKGFWRWVSALNVVVVVASLIFLQTLSTWVAIATILLGSFAAYAYSKPLRSAFPFTPTKKNVALLVGGALFVAALALQLVQKSENRLIGERLENIQHYYHHTDSINLLHHRQNSVAERLLLWKNAERAFAENPIAGIGFNNWKVLSGRYGWPFASSSVVSDIRYVRPHNDWLYILAEEGLLGGVIFLSLFFWAGRQLYKTLRSPCANGAKKLSFLAFCGVVIYALIAMFSLPGDRFYPLLLLVLYLSTLAFLKPDSQATTKIDAWNRFSLLLIVIIGITTSSIAFLRFQSESNLLFALKAQYQKNWPRMAYHSARANTYFFPLDFTGTPISWYQGVAAYNSASPAIARFYFEDALRKSPYHLQVLNDLGTALAHSGNRKKALECYHKALQIAPAFSESYMNAVVLEYNRPNPDKALNLLEHYPRSGDGPYRDLLFAILSDQIKFRLNDSLESKKYLLTGKQHIFEVYKNAKTEKISFETAVRKDIQLHQLKKP
ncbi:MAG: O-antigen ligase family protein [Chitinophagales bacterium]